MSRFINLLQNNLSVFDFKRFELKTNEELIDAGIQAISDIRS